jgi:hypothetical protein
MPLYLEDLDGQIAERLQQRRPGVSCVSPERRAVARAFWDKLALGIAFTFGVAVFALVFPWGALAFAVYLVVMLALLCLLRVSGLRRRWKHEPDRHAIGAPELETVVGLPGLTRQEAAYCRIAACLAEGLPGMEADQLRSLLRQLGELVRKSRELRQAETQLEQLLRTDSVYRLETEREQIHDRLLQTTDPQLRYTLEQALAFNAERVANARVLARTAERLAAQGEVIAQALGSIHSALVRSRLACLDADAATDVLHGVVETVARTNAQTRAVEQAVAEMVALRAA